MKLSYRINTLAQLGLSLEKLPREKLEIWAKKAGNENRWFTPDSVKMAVSGIVKILKKEALEEWVKPYSFRQPGKRIGIVMAGNIPLVGFHDLLCVLISGHTAVIKLSSQDKVLMPLVTDLLGINLSETPTKDSNTEPEREIKKHGFLGKILYVAKLENTDAVIATGSDNSARYFKQYFGKQPHIIRKNRTSCATLSGTESDEDIIALGKDIFSYYGLGCRNVSKLYVPKGYDFTHFLDLMNQFNEIGNHSKWINNYDYNKSIYLVNGEPYLDNGFLLLKKSSEIVSPLSVLYYEEYENLNALLTSVISLNNKIQCIVSNGDGITSWIKFGEAQYPEVWDYADGVDTLKFLERI